MGMHRTKRLLGAAGKLAQLRQAADLTVEINPVSAFTQCNTLNLKYALRRGNNTFR
jgi:hypothetical protein